jgi:hypothetical protein
VGGLFSWLATRTGRLVRFDTLGARDTAWPEVDGSVDAVAPDGLGGWFIGGRFTLVAGQPRARLAHLGADGELDPAWRPAVNGRARLPHFISPFDPEVSALCVVGDTLYVGGLFTSINGQPREHLAAINARTGELLAWDPRPNRDVDAFAAGPGTIYVGGGFTRMGGAGRRRLAAFDATTGALTAWNPAVAGRIRSTIAPVVAALLLDRGRLYVGGMFTEVGGRDRYGLAAFDIATGALTTWSPVAGRLYALAVAGASVYVGGYFVTGETDEFGELVGAEWKSLAAFDARTGRLLPWRADVVLDVDPVYPVNSEPGSVRALAVVGDRLYVGGEFHELAGEPRENLGVVSVTTGAPTDWNPRPIDDVSSLGATGDGVLLGGDFSGLDGRARNGIAAVELATGALLPFDAHPDGAYPSVDALVVRDRTLFAAGDFEWIGGRQRDALAKLDAQTGKAQRWDARLTRRNSAHALAVDGGRLYVGGQFRRIGGRRRHYLAALETRTGHATRWRMDADRQVSVLAIDGHTLYVTGAFTRLGGHSRRHLAAIDLRSGRLTPWNPHPDGSVRALAVGGGRVYLGGSFRHIDGRSRTNLAAVKASDGKLQPWQPRADGPVQALAVIAGTVYAGGDFTSISGVPRERIASLDNSSGVPTTWNPGADSTVLELLATLAGLVAGGWFTALGGTSQTGFAIFPPTGQPPATASNHPPRWLRWRAAGIA